mgnify:CR=1 FL=1
MPVRIFGSFEAFGKGRRLRLGTPALTTGDAASKVYVEPGKHDEFYAFLSGGFNGQFYKQFALTIAFASLISAFNSLTLSPALSALLLRPHDAHPDRLQRAIDAAFGWLFRPFNRFFSTNAERYQRGVSRTLHRRGAVFDPAAPAGEVVLRVRGLRTTAGATLTGGRIQLQSEGAEIYFRHVEIRSSQEFEP